MSVISKVLKADIVTYEDLILSHTIVRDTVVRRNRGEFHADVFRCQFAAGVVQQLFDERLDLGDVILPELDDVAVWVYILGVLEGDIPSFRTWSEE
jgi:hypothetical protein